MKVKFLEVGALGNQTFLVGDVAEVTDQTGQELIDKGYAEKTADSAKVTEPPKPNNPAKAAKSTTANATTKEAETKSE